MAEQVFRVSDVLTRVRLIKADAAYSAASLLIWLTDGLIELYTVCPDSRKKTDMVGVRDFVFLTEDAQAVPCSVQYMPLLVDYVMARAFMEDGDSMDHNKRALEHLKIFFDRAQLHQYGLPSRQTQAPAAAPPGGR